MLTVYCINIDGDLGELWLSDKLEVVGHINANDGHLSSYHRTIFAKVGVNIKYIHLYPTDRENKKIEKESLYDDGDALFNLLKKKITKEIK